MVWLTAFIFTSFSFCVVQLRHFRRFSWPLNLPILTHLCPPVWTTTSRSLVVIVSFFVFRPVCLGPTRLCVSQRDPRLSMQPVMRCMLQSACEELIRKQQRPSHINRHECVRVCVCAFLGRVWSLGSLPGTLTAVCRPTGVLIWRGQADRNEFWSTQGLHGARLSACVCAHFFFLSVCVTVCVCEHVCSLCLSASPSLHDVHTNEGFGYTPLLSGLVQKCVFLCMCVCA